MSTSATEAVDSFADAIEDAAAAVDADVARVGFGYFYVRSVR